MIGKIAFSFAKLVKDFYNKNKILHGRFVHLSEIASGTPISVKSSRSRRYVVMTSVVCASTHITIDLMDFHTAVQIVAGFVNLHGNK